MSKGTKKASYLAGKSKTELIEMVKVLFFGICIYAFFVGFLLGYLG